MKSTFDSVDNKKTQCGPTKKNIKTERARDPNLPPPSETDREDGDASGFQSEEVLLAAAKKMLAKPLYLPASGMYFTQRNGIKLHAKVWMPEDHSKTTAVILFCHGYIANINTIGTDLFFNMLTRKNYAVISFCQPGHGCSYGGIRACVQSVSGWVDNAEDFCDSLLLKTADRHSCQSAKTKTDIKNNFDKELPKSAIQALRSETIPLFICGHSLGGSTAFLLSHRIQKKLESAPWNRFHGTILMAPALHGQIPAPIRWLVFNVFMPSDCCKIMPSAMSKVSTIPPEWLFHDPVRRKVWEIDNWDENDPFGQMQGWPRGMRWATAKAFVENYKLCGSAMSRFNCPFVVIQDPEDKLCLYKGTEQLLKTSPSPDRSVIKIHNALHEMHTNCPQKTADHISSWVQSHLKIKVAPVNMNVRAMNSVSTSADSRMQSAGGLTPRGLASPRAQGSGGANTPTPRESWANLCGAEF